MVSPEIRKTQNYFVIKKLMKNKTFNNIGFDDIAQVVTKVIECLTSTDMNILFWTDLVKSRNQYYLLILFKTFIRQKCFKKMIIYAR